MGRPKLNIDPKKVEALASFGCTNTEIASFYGCERTTITKRFSRIITKGRESGKIRLRQKQFDTAMKGNVSMLIWLGKQTLGQADKQDIDLTNKYEEDIVEKFKAMFKNVGVPNVDEFIARFKKLSDESGGGKTKVLAKTGK